MTDNTKRCATCRHWWPHPLAPQYGKCQAISRKPITGEGYGSDCKKWELRELPGDDQATGKQRKGRG